MIGDEPPFWAWAVKQVSFWHAVAPDRAATRERLISLNRSERDVALFTVAGGTVTIAEKPLPLAPPEQVKQRFAMYRSYLEQVVREFSPTLHCELLFDASDERRLDESVPVFAFQKPQGSKAILIPDVDFIVYDFYEKKIIGDEARFDEKQCSAIFIGSTTGKPIISAQDARDLSLPRLQSAIFFKENSSVIFRLTNIVQCDTPETHKILEDYGFGGKWIPWLEQLNHKFLISIDGNGATCSRVVIALKSNSVLLKYDSPHELYYFSGMRPWIHYIPIHNNQDVTWVIEAERRHPGIFKHIAASGKKFADAYLTRRGTMQYTAFLLEQYASCFTDWPSASKHGSSEGPEGEWRARNDKRPAMKTDGNLSNTAILVLGMHRSGTSAVAGFLQQAGAYLGPNLLPADSRNPKGYFEHGDVVGLHDKILRALGTNWDDPRALPEGWSRDPRIEPFRDRLKEILERDFKGRSLWAIKDPRLCRLLPLWLPVLRDLNVTVKALLVVRNPADVAASLRQRDGMQRERAMMLWLSHTIPAERNSRGLKRTVTVYDDLLIGWQTELQHIRDSLGVDLALAPFLSADEVVFDAGLRHHSEPAIPALSGSENPTAVSVYDAMLRWRREGVSPADVCDQAVRILARDPRPTGAPKLARMDEGEYVAIGGLGGSGTRVVAEILQRAGFYMGPAHNDALDCLLFTLLFQRAEWVQTFPSAADIQSTARIFIAAMKGGLESQIPAIGRLPTGVNEQQILAMRAAQPPRLETYTGIAWKEPNTHIFLPQLADEFPRLKYIHVIRNGLDMALSHNRNQLRNWGKFIGILPKEDEPTERTQLRFWIAANQRVVEFGRTQMKNRFLLLNYDALCEDFVPEASRLVAFLGIDRLLDQHPDLARLIAPRSRNRSLDAAPHLFSEEERASVRAFGFSV
jgi:hypothetical protein